MGRSFKRNDPLHTEKHTVPFKRTCFFIFGYVNLNNNVYILKREGDFGTFDALYVNDVNVFQIFVDQGKFNALTVVQN